MLRKACGRPNCAGVIEERYASALKRRTYCSWRCVQWAAAELKRHGQEEASMRRSLQQIQAALDLSGPPPEALVRVVRRIRTRAYRAGWMVVTNKFRRAIARGVLIYRPQLKADLQLGRAGAGSSTVSRPVILPAAEGQTRDLRLSKKA